MRPAGTYWGRWITVQEAVKRLGLSYRRIRQMMTLAVLCSMGWELGDAMETISARRPVVDFAEVYVNSVEKFLQEQVKTAD